MFPEHSMIYVSLYFGNKVAKDDSSSKEDDISKNINKTSFNKRLDLKFIESWIIVPRLVFSIFIFFRYLIIIFHFNNFNVNYLKRPWKYNLLLESLKIYDSIREVFLELDPSKEKDIEEEYTNHTQSTV